MARGGLTKWFAEKWVDLSRPIYDEDGELVGFEPCGRHKAHEGSHGGAKHYPKCRPLRVAMSMTERERKAAIKRKRKVELQAERLGLSGPGSRAQMVKNPRSNPRKKTPRFPPHPDRAFELEAAAVQQGLFSPSAYERKPEREEEPEADERQGDLFAAPPPKIRENKGEHKFIRRYPVRTHKEGAKRHRKYRYSYDIDESVRTTLPAREGEKIRIPHDGKPGHYEVVARLSNETVGIKHDETDHFLVITDLCLREFARDIYHPAQDSLPGDDIRHAHQREDSLPRSRDDALQMIMEASGIQDHDLAQADEAYREWKANKGKKRQKPPPWRGGQLDSFETDLPRKGKGTGKARRHFTSLLEAFENATKGAVTWRDIEPALALLREVPGFEDARFPDEVYERHVRHDADLRDEGFTVDFRQYGVEPKGTEQEDINEVVFVAETIVPPRIEREAAERAAAEEAATHFETFPEDEDPWSRENPEEGKKIALTSAYDGEPFTYWYEAVPIGELLPTEKLEDDEGLRRAVAQGWTDLSTPDVSPPPLVVAPDGQIHDGHHRFRAAQKLGLTHVPCFIVPWDVYDLVIGGVMTHADLADQLGLGSSTLDPWGF